jgi:transketolase
MYLMRTWQNPPDCRQTREAVFAAAGDNGPCYLRLGRSVLPVIYEEECPFRLGKGIGLREGKDVTIVANGIMVHEALKAHDMLTAKGVRAFLIDLHTVKPLDEELILEAAKRTNAVVVAEEHNIVDGVGAAVAEYLSGTYPVPVVRVGVRDCFAESGEPEDLFIKYHLTAQDILDAVNKAMELK